MSSGNYQQKKSRSQSLIPKDSTLGSGEESNKYYQAANPKTVAIYNNAKLAYKNTPEEDAEEMFFDRIMSPDGDFMVDRQVIVLTRYKTYDEQEHLLIQEELFGRTPIGNPHRFVKMRGVTTHDEPEIEQRMIPGTGEQIRKKGESVLYHKTVYDVDFNTAEVAEAFTRVKEPLRLQMYAHEQGQRPWRIRNRKIWETYEWTDLMKYCQTGETKETRSEKLLAEMKNLTPQDKVSLIEVLLQGVNQAGMQINMQKTETPINANDSGNNPANVGLTTVERDIVLDAEEEATEEEDNKPRKGSKK